MANQFGELNDVEMSTLFYLENLFATDWTDVSLINSFKQVPKVDLPVVCVELPSDETKRLEVGSNTLVSEYLIVVNIFATSNTQRKSLAFYTRDKIRVGYPYFTHSLDANKDLVRTSAGVVTMRSILTDAKIDFGDSAESHDQYRHNLSYTVRKNF